MWSRRGSAAAVQQPDLVVHLGARKTGTSSIQQMLRGNPEVLRSVDSLYPTTPGQTRHSKFALFLTPDQEWEKLPPWVRKHADAPHDFRRQFRQDLLSEFADSGTRRVLLSDEVLFEGSVGLLRRMRRFARNNARSLRLVVYLRRQDDHLVSRYQQEVKRGETRRLTDRTLHLDFSEIYDYAGRLAQVAEVVEPDELVVRRYDRGTFTGGSLLADFLDAAQIGVPLEQWELPEQHNVSLDAESVEFLRLFNLRRCQHDGANTRWMDNRRIHRALGKVADGPTLTLPDPVLDDFMAQFEEGNREVARHWFGEQDGVLFRTPRRTAGTTSVQRIDPARIDHYIDLLALPEGYRRPLRIMAEQEQTSR